MENLSETIQKLNGAITDHVPNGFAQQQALVKLQESVMWIDKAFVDAKAEQDLK